MKRTCQCDLCQRFRRFRKAKREKDFKAMTTICTELMNENCSIGEDLCYEKAIADGSWPSAVEILTKRLAAAKKRKAREKA